MTMIRLGRFFRMISALRCTRTPNCRKAEGRCTNAPAGAWRAAFLLGGAVAKSVDRLTSCSPSAFTSRVKLTASAGPRQNRRWLGWGRAEPGAANSSRGGCLNSTTTSVADAARFFPART